MDIQEGADPVYRSVDGRSPDSISPEMKVHGGAPSGRRPVRTPTSETTIAAGTGLWFAPAAAAAPHPRAQEAAS